MSYNFSEYFRVNRTTASRLSLHCTAGSRYTGSKHIRLALRVNLAGDIESSITIYSIMPWCCVFGCSESGENDGTIHMHRFRSKRSGL